MSQNHFIADMMHKRASLFSNDDESFSGLYYICLTIVMTVAITIKLELQS
jgi:hypothetical protein